MIFTVLEQLARRADDFLRFRDFHSHLTVGGLLDRKFGINRYTLGALTLPALLCGALVMGTPTLFAARAGWAAGTVIAVFVALWLFMKWSSRRRTAVRVDVVAQAGAGAAIGAVIWLTGADKFNPHPFKHLLIPAAGGAALGLRIPAVLAERRATPRAP